MRSRSTRILQILDDIEKTSPIMEAKCSAYILFGDINYENAFV